MEPRPPVPSSCRPPEQAELFPPTGVAFDNARYVALQSEAILERVQRLEGTLYLEFGGKLLFDYHAARVLPGYDPNVKLRLLQRLQEQADIILCIWAEHIERRKIRGDFGITYDADALKLIDDLRAWGLDIAAVVITRYTGQPGATAFRDKLERHGIRALVHGPIPGYPNDVDRIVSDRGFGANPYVPTRKPLVVVTGPGPNSGKMATCLSQIYHVCRGGGRAGYAKFETFPIWNLPLRHPVNLAYEAATADLRDYNLIDPFHLEAYGERSVNYNRDVETFPVLRAILERISGRKGTYRSPTDMGVNRAGFAIVDDAATQRAAVQEIVRRYFRHACELALGLSDAETVQRLELMMRELDVGPEHRPMVAPARRAAEAAHGRPEKGDHGIHCGAAIVLPDGAIVTGVNSPLLHAASSLVLNALKHLADIPDRLHLLSPGIIQSVAHLKQDILRRKTVSLNLEETLIALAIASTTSPTAELALAQIGRLAGCEVHLSHMPSAGDEAGLRRLGVNLTADPRFATSDLFEG